jgi:RNA recognition motif-containing protein
LSPILVSCRISRCSYLQHRYPEIAFGLVKKETDLNIYVGNLSYDTTESELNTAFAAYGAVSSARLATDRDTGRTRGFGFVEMANDAEAQAAISALNGSQLQGRTLTVNEAKPREARSSGGNRGYAGGGNRW